MEMFLYKINVLTKGRNGKEKEKKANLMKKFNTLLRKYYRVFFINFMITNIDNIIASSKL